MLTRTEEKQVLQEGLEQLRRAVDTLRPALTQVRPITEREREHRERVLSSLTRSVTVVELFLLDYADPPVGNPVPQRSAGVPDGNGTAG